MPSGSRLVASRCTRGQRRTIASAVLAQPPIRCSQLSTTISTSCGARASSRASSAGRPGLTASRSACEMAAGTASSSVTAASSTSHTPSPDPSSSSAATCSPSRVLPHPPAPVRVTRRDDSTSARTSATSRSRPMNADSWAGRLFGSAGLPSDRSGGNPACRPAALQLEDPFRAAQVLQPVDAQIGQRRARRQPVPHQHRRRLRHQHLPPVARPRPPGRPGAPPGPPARWPSAPPPRNGCPSAPAPAPRPARHAPRWPAASPAPPPRTPAARRTPRRTHPPACPPRGRRARPAPTGSARDDRPAPARRPSSPSRRSSAVEPSMSVNKNVRVSTPTA